MRLGFATEYTPGTAAYAKRESTQNKWAYGSGGELDPTSGLWYTSYYDHTALQRIKTLVPEHLQPIIIDNDMLEGFKIITSVVRNSTSNKLWRILDPRGFELEISTACMEEIILSGVIDRGVIIGPCIWSTSKHLMRTP